MIVLFDGEDRIEEYYRQGSLVVRKWYTHGDFLKEELYEAPYWIFFTARRYLKERQSSRALAASFLSTAGIAVGVLTLVVVMGVMNGFQLGFIEDILEIRSYDVRISGLSEAEIADLTALIEDVRGVKAVVPFLETQTLARGRFGSFEAVEVRGLPRDAAERDPGLLEQIKIYDGDFSLKGGLVLGRELARALGVHIGDSVTLAALSGGGYAGLVPASHEIPVTGLFRAGFMSTTVVWFFPHWIPLKASHPNRPPCNRHKVKKQVPPERFTGGNEGSA